MCQYVKMKRQHTEEHKEPTFQFTTCKEDRLEKAVAAACFITDKEKPDVVTLSDQPIILLCRNEEVCYEQHLVYWPANVEVGLRVVRALNRLADNQIETHIKVMEVLQSLARKKHLTPNSLKHVCEYFKVEYAEELGHFMFLEEDGIDLFGADRIDKSCIIEETVLSPHLYRLTCYVFC